MAWIFALLVVLNGVYWAYETYFDAPPAPVDLQQKSAWPGLQLYHGNEAAVPAKDLIASPLTAAAASTSEAPACVLVGPFSPSEGEVARTSLKTQGLVALSRPQDSSGHGVWVYMPPVQYIADAEAMAARLRAQGHEAEVIDQGGFAGAISLGHYHSDDAAAQLMQKLSAQGYTAESRAEMVPDSQVWIFVQPVTPEDQVKLQRWVQHHAHLHAEDISCS